VVLASGLPEVEITLFTLGFQAIVFALYLLVANGAYCLGVAAERVVRPSDVARFRAVLFRLGVGLTVAPLLAVALLVVLGRVFGQ
jgi:hypothetical protein